MNGQTSFQPVTVIQTRRPDTDEESDTDAESVSSDLDQEDSQDDSL